MKSASDLKTLFRNSSTLRQLMVHSQRLATLQTQLEQCLQEAARPHCKVGAFDEGCLILIITDGAWATRLRYQKNILIKQLRNFSTFMELQHIQFRIEPKTEPQIKTRARPVLSADAAALLEATANNVEDSKLQAALRRLAKHAAQSDDESSST